jgi:hypothetical protein
LLLLLLLLVLLPVLLMLLLVASALALPTADRAKLLLRRRLPSHSAGGLSEVTGIQAWLLAAFLATAPLMAVTAGCSVGMLRNTLYMVQMSSCTQHRWRADAGCGLNVCSVSAL